MRDASLRPEGQLLAALRVASDDAATPAELLTVHVYWANTLRKLGTSLFPVDDIERLVTAGWFRLSDCPFLLRTPSFAVPELKRACASVARGWCKIGEVLSAALHAVPATVPESMRQTIRSLLLD